MMTTTDLLDEEHEDLNDFSPAQYQPQIYQTTITLDDSYATYFGERLDKATTQILAQNSTQSLGEFSREQIKDWLESGELQINGQTQKPKYRLKQGDILTLNATVADQQADLPENIPLDILYEDESVLVINKPADMVVHPGAGNWSGTLVNALLYHYPASRALPRAGLVHRIDKQTTGLLIVAKDSQSQLHLINQLKDKSVYRHYQALVLASPTELKTHHTIDAPIARHPTQRTKMAVVSGGKNAVTHLEKVTPICEGLSLVNLRLETGRTHQIRVHLSHLGFSLLGDPVYGSARRMAILLKNLDKNQDDTQKALVQNFDRQALHAYELGFIHPKSGELVTVIAPLPNDMQELIEGLQD